jgi:predicted unusual protein kinase regulating ubiquinone biosynthesis (AarF/ABC1/UbiB family)
MGMRVAGRVVWMALVFAPLGVTLPFALMAHGTYRVVCGLSLLFLPATAAAAEQKGKKGKKEGMEGDAEDDRDREGADHSDDADNQQQLWTWRMWFRLLVLCLQYAGPLAIKFGQWASTRPDVFARSFCSELEVLHEHVHSTPLRPETRRQLAKAVRRQCRAVAAHSCHPPIRWRRRRSASRNGDGDGDESKGEEVPEEWEWEEAGVVGDNQLDSDNDKDDDDDDDYNDAFATIDAQPIGAGCIAQVHRASLNTRRYCPGCAKVSSHLHRRTKACGLPPREEVELALKIRRPSVSAT